MLVAKQSDERRGSAAVAIFLTVVLLALGVLVANAQVGQDPGASGNLFPVGVSSSTFGRPSLNEIYTLLDPMIGKRQAATWLWVDSGG